jgi:hypothetical protein
MRLRVLKGLLALGLICTGVALLWSVPAAILVAGVLLYVETAT